MVHRYEELYQLSIEDPERFWAAEAEKLHWFKRWDKVLDDSRAPFFRWFPGGETNLCYNAVDRHALGPRGDRPAIIWESPETGGSRIITFLELYRLVNRFSAVLKARGVKKGDRVLIYMPMVPEALVAVLACARIGAIHSIIFAGFSYEALADRIDDCEPKLLVCADGGVRKGKTIPLKRIVDRALAAASTEVPYVIVLDRGLEEGKDWRTDPGRDLSWEEELERVREAEVEPERLLSTDPSYILYTSGTTAKPKGIVRDTGGYMVALHASMWQVYG
ncbi:TPA: propionyl-CoA synthetase, partial [Candidatus Bipolaricaulota bacterium]|nr:propionyl-CoA synthetase [Candidatus Bipolaricaulota bacterium]